MAKHHDLFSDPPKPKRLKFKPITAVPNQLYAHAPPSAPGQADLAAQLATMQQTLMQLSQHINLPKVTSDTATGPMVPKPGESINTIPKQILRIPSYTTDAEDSSSDEEDSGVSGANPAGTPPPTLGSPSQVVDSFVLNEDKVEVQIAASEEEDFGAQHSEQSYSSEEEMPSDSESIASSALSHMEDTSSLWQRTIMDIATRRNVQLPLTAPEPAPAGVSPKRPVQQFLLPPTAFMQYQGEKMQTQFKTDMDKADSYKSIFPRPPKFNIKYMFAGDQWGDKPKVARPQVNSNFTQLLTDNKRNAGTPMGHCTLTAKDTMLLESACGWQKRHLSYSEHLIGNAIDNLKEAQNKLPTDLDPETTALLQQSTTSLKLAVDLYQKQLLPTQSFLASRIEIGRRDSYLQRLHSSVEEETRKQIRASRFALSPHEPLFDPLPLLQASSDIKQRAKTGYVHHTTSGSKFPRQRLEPKAKKEKFVKPKQQPQNSQQANKRRNKNKKGKGKKGNQ